MGGCVHNIDHPLKAGRFLLQLLVDGLPPNNINHSVYPLYILMLSINALSSHSVHIFAKIFFLSITIIASPFFSQYFSVRILCSVKLNPIGVDGWILIILKPHRQYFCSIFCQLRQNWIICKIQNSSVGKNWRKLGAKHHQLYV